MVNLTRENTSQEALELIIDITLQQKRTGYGVTYAYWCESEGGYELICPEGLRQIFWDIEIPEAIGSHIRITVSKARRAGSRTAHLYLCNGFSVRRGIQETRLTERLGLLLRAWMPCFAPVEKVWVTIEEVTG